MSDEDVEVPEADAIEQEQDAGRAAAERAGQGSASAGLPLEADEADVAEQSAELEQDDDDYR